MVFCFSVADAQKQERIQQLLTESNRCEQLDKELTNLQQKYRELEQILATKDTEISQQHDEFQSKIEQLEQLQSKHDQSVQNESKTNIENELRQELNEVKTKNNLLRQRNSKIMEQLNKLSHKPEQCQNDQPS